MAKFTYKNNDKEEILYKHFENRLLLCPKASLATLAENKAAIKVGAEAYSTKPVKIEKQPIISQEGVCPKCGKKHIDLADESKWQTQFSDIFGTKDEQKVACFKASKRIFKKLWCKWRG